MPPWHHHQIYVWLIIDLLSASQINVCSFPLFLKVTYVNGELLTGLRMKIKGVLVIIVCIFSPLGLKSLLYYLVSPPSIKRYLF